MKRVFLIGYMGAGKSTVGKRLAKRMNLAFVDLDKYIEVRYHRTIDRLFAEKGEEAFREIERKMLHEVSTFENVLVSTGGGSPCFFDNMQFMNGAGKTVYLKVSPIELAKRLEFSKHPRPVLEGRSGRGLEAFVRESLEKREAFYMQASVVFDVEAMVTDLDMENVSEALEKVI
jgi:shikimate kinase